MSPTLRTITSGTLDWRGIIVHITLERQAHVDHLQIETLDPQRAPIPVSETGYLSRFVGKDVFPPETDPAAYVQDWLDQAATGKGWIEQEAAIRQYVLF